jgi:crotonobetainyl-CoA:carnitine CoA-transferase CaiB-like acyl-CoA transferase
MSGLMAVTGEPHGPPARAGAPVVDVASGVYAALSAMLGLWSRAREASATSPRFQVRMLEVALALQAPNVTMEFHGIPSARLGSGSYFSMSERFQTADGMLVISAGSNRAWRALCGLLADPFFDLYVDTSNEERMELRDVLVPRLTDHFRRLTTQEWDERLRAARIPFGPIFTYADAIEYLGRSVTGADSHGLADGLLRPVFAGFSAAPLGPAPGLGADTFGVLEEAGVGLAGIWQAAGDGLVGGAERAGGAS